MKLADIDPIIKAIEARHDNAEDLPPLTTGDFLRMLREASEPKTGGIQLIIREDGSAEQYDDTFDLTIHCTSEDEQKEVLKIMNQAEELRQLKSHGDLIDREVLKAHIDHECVRRRIFTGITIAEAMKQIANEVPVVIERSEE
jgi:hypothetical protein